MRMVERYKILNGLIDLKQVNRLISKKVLSNYDMVSVFVNKNELMERHNIVGTQFYTTP